MIRKVRRRCDGPYGVKGVREEVGLRNVFHLNKAEYTAMLDDCMCDRNVSGHSEFGI